MKLTLCDQTIPVSNHCRLLRRIYFSACCLILQLITIGASVPAIADNQIACPTEFPPHPRLFTNPDELKTLKRFIQVNPEARNFATSFISRVETQLKNIPRPPDQPRDMENRGISILARDFAIAYVLTGNEKYATASAEILLSYAEVYPGYEITETKGKAMPSTLNEARWAIDLATAYDLIYQSQALSKSDKKKIEKYLKIYSKSI